MSKGRLEGEKIMSETMWVMCPVCSHKTRTKLRQDTELKNFPLFCPKCKNECIVNVKNYQIETISDNG